MDIETIKSGILGLAVADALGVPVEFCHREALKTNPVTDMRGYGTYHQPPGTWSDDTSLTLCLMDSLAGGLDYTDIMNKFRQWMENGAYTPNGCAFDMGNATAAAIRRFAAGTEPLSCGGRGEYDNGNGSLMRILPLAFYIRARYGIEPERNGEAMQLIHTVSALTHAHKRCQIACGIYIVTASLLLSGMPLSDALREGPQRAAAYYGADEAYTAELECYDWLLAPDFKDTPEQGIQSSGYVADTLEAAFWCLFNTDNYHDCVQKAVNLGEDTDTVAAVAGGLAGLAYGYAAIPEKWQETLVRREEIETICERFFAAL